MEPPLPLCFYVQFVESGVKFIASGASPIHIKRGIEKSVKVISTEIEKLSRAVIDERDIHKIAKISAGGNDEVGKYIYEAVQMVGRSGVITIEEGKSTSMQIENVKGMRFDRGYVSPYFSTNNEKQICEIQNPKILVTDKKITTIHDLLNLLQPLAASSQSLLVIADDIESDALSTLVVNKLRGTLNVCAVKAPGFGDRKKAMLEDIAILTGATLISEDQGTALKDCTEEVLGTVSSVTITKDHTTMVSDSHGSCEVADRIKQIEHEIENATSSYDKEQLEERKAKLSGGVALIRVGAPTEPEMKQKKQLFEDSLAATRASMEQGVVIGGGVAFLRAKAALDTLKLEKEESLGAQIVAKALEAPFRQIVKNSGMSDAIVLEQVMKSDEKMGFNALTEKVEDFFEAGIIDPAKVLLQALQFAASSAATILLSEVLIGNAPEDE